MTDTQHSTNERAAQLMGYRVPESKTPPIVLFSPAEQGYACPIHGAREIEDHSLQWSEYNGFLWCALCDKDYPSALCCTGTDLSAVLDRAIEVYLDTVCDAVNRNLSPAQTGMTHRSTS